MHTLALLWRNLSYYRRSNFAVIAGVATAVSVLAGALLVGDSVRASLRSLALDRLGRTDTVLRSTGLFREALAARYRDAAPMLWLEGLVTRQADSRRATQVAVYGVDDRFWKFHSRAPVPLAGREAALSRALAEELGAQPGDTLLLRLQQPSDIPAETLYGRKESAGASIRLTLKEVLGPERFGEFSLRPQQGAVRALYLPLSRLQDEISAPGKVNTLLAGAGSPNPEKTLSAAFTLADVGMRVREITGANALQFDTASGVIDDTLAASARTAASSAGLVTVPVLTYLANTMTVDRHNAWYSLVAAADLSVLGVDAGPDAIVLNEWLARDLAARRGDSLQMDYYVWHDDGTMSTEKASFRVAAIVPISGLAADRNLTPDYPGITDAENVSDWNPPFPLNLSQVTRRDEDYWHRYRTTPKAWIPIERGQQLWASRFGKLTALRLVPEHPADRSAALAAFRDHLRAAVNPLSSGFTAIPVRRLSIESSRGATDFGEYFVYFSFFLMVSALLLAGLFFRLGVEQRAQEIGVLEAVGFPPRRVRRLFLSEALVLALCGGAIGVAGSLAYAWFILTGLGTWWVDAVGTRRLALAFSPEPLAYGVVGGVIASLLATWFALRVLRGMSARQLLAGGRREAQVSFRSRGALVGIVCTLLGLALIGAGASAAIAPEGAFFGAGSLILIAALAFLRGRLAASVDRLVSGTGAAALRRLAFRNAAYRPGRTVLSAALIASATFLIVSLEAFRQDAHQGTLDPQSGTGGYSLMAESVRPVFYNPNTEDGRLNLNLPDLPETQFVSFRLRPGDDASCLNLYQPQNPRILGAPHDFLQQARFSFADTAGEKNPWLLLESDPSDGAIPAIADINSMTYVLHKGIGDVVVLPDGVRLRLVAALRDSIFQSELIVSDARFIKAFPRQEGFRVFLMATPEGAADRVAAAVENALADQGIDVVSTSEKLAAFHRVENTYLSTFQMLGGLGLLLGTVGLAAILFRNVLERRRELALLASVGYKRGTLLLLVLVENLFLLFAGLGAGIVAAALAVSPVIASRGFAVSLVSMTALLALVALVGVFATLAAALTAMRQPLLTSLRAG